MTFEQLVDDLNKRNIYILDLTQLENGKKWSVRLWSKTKPTTNAVQGKTIEQAVKGALAALKSQMTDKDWKELAKNQPAPVKKIRVRAKGR